MASIILQMMAKLCRTVNTSVSKTPQLVRFPRASQRSIDHLPDLAMISSSGDSTLKIAISATTLLLLGHAKVSIRLSVCHECHVGRQLTENARQS